MPSESEIERTIHEAIASRRHGGPAVVSNDQRLQDDLGLSSLDLVELVEHLETTLRLKVVNRAFALTDVRTVGDLCRAYRAGSAGSGPDEVLLASRRRAEARRRGRRP